MKNNEPPDIHALRVYFKGLKLAQQKEFVQNLQKKLAGTPNSKYQPFLKECIQQYNNAVRAKKEEKTNNSPTDEATAILFAKAISGLLSGQKTDTSALPYIRSKLTGTWRREAGGKVFYYTFKSDDTLETNEVAGHDVFQGYYTVSEDNIVLMQPHEVLQIRDIVFATSGKCLTITLENGMTYEYTRGSV